MKSKVKFSLRRLFQGIKKSVLHQFWLKLISVVIALILWSYIVDVTPDLTRSAYVDGLSVSVTGAASLHNYGLALATDVYHEYEGQISAGLEVSQRMYSKITADSITVMLDVSNIRTSGVHEVPLTASSANGTITDIYPSTLTVKVDYLDSREVPVDGKLTGTLKEDYWYQINESTLNPQTITISGPASIVQQAAAVCAEVDVTGQDTSFRRTSILRILDTSGEILSPRLLTRTSSTCTMSIDIYPTKELPVTADVSQLVIPEDYEVAEITFQPPTVTVAAKSQLLEDINSLPVEIPENMPTLNKTLTKRLTISRLPEFKFMSTNQVYMTITVREKETQAAITGVQVQPFGLDESFEVLLQPHEIAVQVTGPVSVVEALTADDIYAYIDITGLSAGTHETEVFIGNNSDLSYDSIIPQKIKVIISDGKSNVITQTEE